MCDILPGKDCMPTIRHSYSNGYTFFLGKGFNLYKSVLYCELGNLDPIKLADAGLSEYILRYSTENGFPEKDKCFACEYDKLEVNYASEILQLSKVLQSIDDLYKVWQTDKSLQCKCASSKKCKSIDTTFIKNSIKHIIKTPSSGKMYTLMKILPLKLSDFSKRLKINLDEPDTQNSPNSKSPYSLFMDGILHEINEMDLSDDSKLYLLDTLVDSNSYYKFYDSITRIIDSIMFNISSAYYLYITRFSLRISDEKIRDIIRKLSKSLHEIPDPPGCVQDCLELFEKSTEYFLTNLDQTNGLKLINKSMLAVMNLSNFVEYIEVQSDDYFDSSTTERQNERYFCNLELSLTEIMVTCDKIFTNPIKIKIRNRKKKTSQVKKRYCDDVVESTSSSSSSEDDVEIRGDILVENTENVNNIEIVPAIPEVNLLVEIPHTDVSPLQKVYSVAPITTHHERESNKLSLSKRNVTYRDVQTEMNTFGWRPYASKGGHRQFVDPTGKQKIDVPCHGKNTSLSMGVIKKIRKILSGE